MRKRIYPQSANDDNYQENNTLRERRRKCSSKRLLVCISISALFFYIPASSQLLQFDDSSSRNNNLRHDSSITTTTSNVQQSTITKDSLFGKKRFIQSYHDIMKTNDSGRSIQDRDYARKTLTGEFVWPCDEGNTHDPSTLEDNDTNEISKEENPDMCNAQFPVLDYSDYVQEFTGELNERIDPDSLVLPPLPSIDELLSKSNNECMVLTRRAYKGGKVSMQVNQDRPFILHKDSDNYILGIFDGHGEFGHAVSHFLLLKLIQHFFGNMPPFAKDQDIDLVEKAWTSLFREMDSEIPKQLAADAGSTASIIARSSNEVYIVNTGDSISFIAAYDKAKMKSMDSASDKSVQSSAIQIVFQSKKHKAHFPGERERIEEAGGVIQLPRILFGENISSRVNYPVPGGFQYSLAMSRSIGDALSKNSGVIVDPDVSVLRIDELKKNMSGQEGGIHDEVGEIGLILVSISDGMFDHLNIEYVARRLAYGLEKGEKTALYEVCVDLISESSNLWNKISVGRGDILYRDDISIAVHKL